MMLTVPSADQSSVCLAGAEALFADMGHFNCISLQISTMCLVYPCILASYIGQGALRLAQV